MKFRPLAIALALSLAATLTATPAAAQQTGSDKAWQQASKPIEEGLSCHDQIDMRNPAIAQLFEFVSEADGFKNYRALPPKSFTVLGLPVSEITLSVAPDNTGIYAFTTSTPAQQIHAAVAKRHAQDQSANASMSDFCSNWMCDLTVNPVENVPALQRVECSTLGD